MLLLPMMVLALPWYEILIGFMLMHLSAGLLLSFVAVLGYFVEGLPSLNLMPQVQSKEAGEITNWRRRLILLMEVILRTG